MTEDDGISFRREFLEKVEDVVDLVALMSEVDFELIGSDYNTVKTELIEEITDIMFGVLDDPNISEIEKRVTLTASVVVIGLERLFLLMKVKELNSQTHQ